MSFSSCSVVTLLLPRPRPATCEHRIRSTSFMPFYDDEAVLAAGIDTCRLERATFEFPF